MGSSTHAEMGELIRLGADDVFVLDTGDPESGTSRPPIFVIHGFPTSSVDWSAVLPAMSAGRRVILMDLPGFGYSAKPDRPYSIDSSADSAQAVLEHLELDVIDLVTHDMGDTVGGEILARQMESKLTTSVRKRVVSNGSIYLDMARLTDGQQVLWSAPDEALPPEMAPTAEMLSLSLTATLAPGAADPTTEKSGSDAPLATAEQVQRHMDAAASAVAHNEGTRLLPRLIRYLSDRRDNEERYTGAIENHPSKLGVVWGTLDPIAVIAMARKLSERTDAELIELTEVGHYPMIEAPGAFASAVLRLLD